MALIRIHKGHAFLILVILFYRIVLYTLLSFIQSNAFRDFWIHRYKKKKAERIKWSKNLTLDNMHVAHRSFTSFHQHRWCYSETKNSSHTIHSWSSWYIARPSEPTKKRKHTFQICTYVHQPVLVYRGTTREKSTPRRCSLPSVPCLNLRTHFWRSLAKRRCAVEVCDPCDLYITCRNLVNEVTTGSRWNDTEW